MKRVFTSQDPSAIAIVRGLLAEEGIDTAIQNETLSSVLGEVPWVLAMPELWVREEDEARALAVVEQFESGGERGQDRPSWTCPSCGEVVEGQFAACWQCGKPMEPASEGS